MTTYEIRRNDNYNSLEIYFNHKPSESILKVMHDNKFRWNFKKYCWYGFADEHDMTAQLNNAEIEGKNEIATGGVVGDGYMGGGEWTGCNSSRWLSYSEINKIVKKEMQRLFPGIKFATRGKSFSGGQSSTFYICLPSSELFANEEIAREVFNENIFKSYWLYLPDGSSVPASMANDEQRERAFLKLWEDLHGQRYIDAGYAEYLTEKAAKMYYKAKELYQSFIHDESNSMVDYFDRSLYDSYNFVNLDAEKKEWHTV